MDSIEVSIASIRGLIDVGDYQGAKQALLMSKAIYDSNENSVRLLVEEGHVERKHGDIKKAIAIFSKINRLSKKSNYYDLGICFRRAKMPEVAQLFLIREELRSGVTEYTRIERSLAYQMSSEFEQAKTCLVEAVALGLPVKKLIGAICRVPFLKLNDDDVQVIVTACMESENGKECLDVLSSGLKPVNYQNTSTCSVPFAFLLGNEVLAVSPRSNMVKKYADRVKGLTARDDLYLDEIDVLLRDGTCMYIDELVGKVTSLDNCCSVAQEKIDIFSFWDTVEPPAEVKENVVTWAHIAKSEPLYSEKLACDFILKHFDEKMLVCFNKCHHPAMKSDLFRLLKLSVDGGFYVDADERLIADVGPLFKLLETLEVDRLFVVDVVSERMYLHNYAIFCRPKDEVVLAAIDQAVEIISTLGEESLRGKIWKITGPGNLSKAMLSKFIQDYTLIPRTAFLSSISFRKIFDSPEQAYKADPVKNWRHH